jgi:hypothetical protein
VKILVKFKDGMVIDVPIQEGSGFLGQGNLLELIQKGKELNSTIQFGDLERRYSDLYSYEIILRKKEHPFEGAFIS